MEASKCSSILDREEESDEDEKLIGEVWQSHPSDEAYEKGVSAVVVPKKPMEMVGVVSRPGVVLCSGVGHTSTDTVLESGRRKRDTSNVYGEHSKSDVDTLRPLT